MDGIDITSQGDTTVGGDIVGGDKIVQQHFGHTTEPRPTPRMAPPVPQVFVGRDKALRELVAALRLPSPPGPLSRSQTARTGEGEKRGEGHTLALTALKGMGGVGKTTLAAALANHLEVKAALPDGTLWAGLGPDPDVMTWLAVWGAQFGVDLAQYDSPEARSRALATLLHDKKALLVVDDVWEADHACYFLDAAGPGCRALITTRDNAVAHNLAGRETHRVETLTEDAALDLMRQLAPEAVAADEKGARELAQQLGGLPLALNLAGQMLAAEWEAGLGVQGALDELKAREARLKLAGAEKRVGLAAAAPSLRAVLGMSYDRLPDDAAKRAFRHLGAFGSKPRTFSLEAATAVWGLEPRPAQKMMAVLVGRALVEVMEGGRYALHTTLADYAESLLAEHGEAADVRAAHAQYYLEFAEANAEEK